MTEMSAAEAATVARFEAGEPAPESWDGGLREALVTVLHNIRECDDAPWGGEPECEAGADALLPVVTVYAERQARGRAAEELFVLASRLVAQDVKDMAVYDEIRALRDALADRTDRPPC